MISYNFKLLPRDEQVAILYEDGVFIGKRNIGKTTFVLYQLDSFYVEISYDKYRYFVSSINVCSNIEILDPYLDTINIGELIT